MLGAMEARPPDTPPAWIVPPQDALPPPMVGPIAIAPLSDPVAAPPENNPSTPAAPEAPAPDPPPIEEPKAPGLPLDKYPVESCAAIAARIAQRPEDEGAILEAEKLSKETWEAVHAHWLDAIREEATRGKRKMLSAYDIAYVAALEADRGPITPTEYARILIAAERGQGEQMLTKLRLPEGVMIRLRRVWLERTVKDPKVGEEVRAAMRREA